MRRVHRARHGGPSSETEATGRAPLSDEPAARHLVAVLRTYLAQYERDIGNHTESPKVLARLLAMKRAAFNDDLSGDVLVALLEIARECARQMRGTQLEEGSLEAVLGVVHEPADAVSALEIAIWGTGRPEYDLLEEIASPRAAAVRATLIEAARGLLGDPETERIPTGVALALAVAATKLGVMTGKSATSGASKLNTGRTRVPRAR